MAQESAFQLRLGLVLYGGASLAVYMSGMTQELLAVVRAAQARKVLSRPGNRSLVLQQWAAREVETNPYAGILEQANIDVMIDVIAGTSAGGLNGLTLAKALAAGAPELGALTDPLWRDHADMEPLARFDTDPRSVVSGDYLYTELQSMLRSIGGAGRPQLGDLVRVLDLFITATDVRGHHWQRWDRFHQKLQGQSHKYLFHLRKRTRQGGDLRGYDCNDFHTLDPVRREKIDTLLAKIGRATSAFPAVFPPERITPADAQAAGVDVLGDVGPGGADGIWFSDGGILENAPFEPVLDTIFERGANQPVRRVLVFLEPDPSTAGAPAQTEPGMLETLAAAVTLPMQQDIFDKLERLGLENQRRRHLMELLKGLDGGLAPAADAAGTALLQAAAAAAAQQAPAVGVETRTYLQMRLNRLRQVVRDGLRRALEGLQVQRAVLDEAVALLAERLMPIPEPWGDAELPRVLHFLEQYDAEFHGRRLHYLLARVHEHCAPGARPRSAAAVARLTGRLWGALEDWNNALWVMAHAGRLGAQPKRWQQLTADLDQAMVRLAAAMTSQGEPGEKAAAADGAVLALARYAEGVHAASGEEIQQAFAEAEIALELTGPGDGARRLDAGLLQEAFHDFAALDRILFPIELGSGRGLWGEIGLYGFRPDAARTWVTKTTAEKLTGEALGHFAAFLDARWRENDMLWGRLDAAELLFRMIARESGLIGAEEPLPARAEAVLLKRRRQILGAYPNLIDLQRLRAMTLGKPVEPEERATGLPLRDRLVQAWQLATRGEVAAALMAAPAGPAFSIDQVPSDVLKEYLTNHYKVGEEGLDALPGGRLAGELLLMLDNTVRALGKTTTSAFAGKVQRLLLAVLVPLRWIARLLLMPRHGLMGLVRSHLALLMALVGAVLLFLWATGSIRLGSGGKLLLAALLITLFGSAWLTWRLKRQWRRTAQARHRAGAAAPPERSL
ncbi:MAG TPA: patatin-like protein [Symbiobacteriaceae bacterium]|nr:patatin-like protein [Symbiobacteriaceae bacterium]